MVAVAASGVVNRRSTLMTAMPALRLAERQEERSAVLRQDDERVGVLRDRLLDLLGLGVGVGGLEEGELDVVVRVGGSLRAFFEIAPSQP